MEGTRLGLKAIREIEPSGSQVGQNYIRTGVSGDISQRLTDRFKLTLTAGYHQSEYQDVDGAGDATRSDDIYFVRPGVRYQNDRFHADLYYERREDSSSDGFSYEVNHFGLIVGAEF